MEETTARSHPTPGGSSGAKILVHPQSLLVEKRGDMRVALQGAWLQQHAHDQLPAVYSVDHDGYTMERLTDHGPAHLYDGARVVQEIHAALDRACWSRRPVWKFNLEAHIGKMKPLWMNMHRDTWLRAGELFDAIRWEDLCPGMTHGDPTWDNVMFRGNTLVLTDPIPATPSVPDLVSVDLGKVLQSVVGFEAIRYGRPSNLLYGVEPNDVKALCLDDNEWLATQYWCIVHFARAHPYMPREVQDGIVSLARAVARSV